MFCGSAWARIPRRASGTLTGFISGDIGLSPAWPNSASTICPSSWPIRSVINRRPRLFSAACVASATSTTSSLILPEAIEAKALAAPQTRPGNALEAMPSDTASGVQASPPRPLRAPVGVCGCFDCDGDLGSAFRRRRGRSALRLARSHRRRAFDEARSLPGVRQFRLARIRRAQLAFTSGPRPSRRARPLQDAGGPRAASLGDVQVPLRTVRGRA